MYERRTTPFWPSSLEQNGQFRTSTFSSERPEFDFCCAKQCACRVEGMSLFGYKGATGLSFTAYEPPLSSLNADYSHGSIKNYKDGDCNDCEPSGCSRPLLHCFIYCCGQRQCRGNLRRPSRTGVSNSKAILDKALRALQGWFSVIGIHDVVEDVRPWRYEFLPRKLRDWWTVL